MTGTGMKQEDAASWIRDRIRPDEISKYQRDGRDFIHAYCSKPHVGGFEMAFQ